MQVGRALHKKRSLVSQPPPPQWFLDFLSSQKELPRGDQYPLGRCPKCKRTDTISSPPHDYARAECISCGYAGSKNEFIIDDVGYGYPPDQCPTCSGFWSEADTDERPTDLCRMFCRHCGFERYYFLADFTPSLPRGVPNLCPSCGKEWQRRICHYRKLVWMLCLSCGHEQYYIRHGRGRGEPVQCLEYALRGRTLVEAKRLRHAIDAGH